MQLILIYKAIWFILPLHIANMTPVFVKKINFLNFPVDFGKSLHGKRILGDHKTWRGLILGTIAGGLFSLIQGRGLVIGLLIGFGGLTGDMAGSFIKRRLAISEGKKLIILDQINFVAGGLLFCFLLGKLDLGASQVIFILIFSPMASFLSSVIGYKLKLKEVPW